MLVLSRKAMESLQIGPDIVVTVIRIAGDKVRLAISAPRDVRILRTELVDPGQGDPPATN